MATDDSSSYPRTQGRKKLTITLDDLEPETTTRLVVSPAPAAAPPPSEPTARHDVVAPPPPPAPRSVREPVAPLPAPPASYAAPGYYAPPPAPVNHGRGARAGFWKRYWALFLDGLLLGVPSVVIILLFGIFGLVLTIPLTLAYFTFFEGGPRGQTPGKAALDIRVVSLNTGGPIGYGAAFGRQLGRFLSGLIFDLGYLWMLWDRERQTWHDKFVGSIVVPVLEYPIA